jgi:hypothetical protein
MSDLSKILESVKESNAAANKERLSSPELIQKTRALRASAGSPIRRARTTAAAGAAATIVCNLLDSDDVEITSGDEANVTVYCDICGGGNLDNAWPHLANDQDIVVFKHNDKWRCLWGFQKVSVCA